MAICTKINTAGTTLQNNLNARGVSCTYGKNSESKQTIKDMADLITASNLKGSADSIIHISASRPYLLEDETTDLTVKLVNGLGEPLPNKSVSISDGSSLYSGITNNEGIVKLYDISITEDTTYTATYQSITASITLEYCIFADYNDPSNYILQNTSTNSVTVENQVIKIANTSGSGNSSCFFSLNTDAITGDFKVIYDLQTNNTVALYQQLGTSRTENTVRVNGDINHSTFKTVEWTVQGGTMNVKIDGTTWKTTTYSSGTYYPIFAFYFNVGEYAYITNLRIKTL